MSFISFDFFLIFFDLTLDYGAEKLGFGLRLYPWDLSILINFNPQFFFTGIHPAKASKKLRKFIVEGDLYQVVKIGFIILISTPIPKNFNSSTPMQTLIPLLCDPNGIHEAEALGALYEIFPFLIRDEHPYP